MGLAAWFTLWGVDDWAGVSVASTPQPQSTVDVDTIAAAGAAVSTLVEYAVDGFFTYQPVQGRPTVEQVNQIAIRLAGLSTEGSACAKGMVAEFEISVVLCIDDDPRKGVDTANASGPDIAKTMWRVWGGLVHTSQQLQRRSVFGTDNPKCDQIVFGDFTISYELGRALGRGTMSFPVPTEPVAISTVTVGS